jgi:pentatricopeptide repeat protein
MLALLKDSILAGLLGFPSIWLANCAFGQSCLIILCRPYQPTIPQALEIFHAMRDRKDVKPNTFSYSALISALARAGRWKEAETFFNELQGLAEEDEYCKPNTVTYAAMISGKFPA